MYAPDKYREQRPEVLVAAMDDIRFATVVGCAPDGPEAIHVPLLVGSAGDDVWLDGHVSKSNPVVGLLPERAPALAIFNGPHAYISPTWMRETGVSGRTAPTWAYVAVQARGTFEWRSEPAWLHEHVAALTDVAECSTGTGWSTSLMPEDYAAALVGGIAGFRIHVRLMEGVWKIMQHSEVADRERIATAMRDAGSLQAMMASAITSGVAP